MKLFFRKIGQGPPLIILHGLYGSSDNWISIAKSISHKFTIYLPDQRNHGRSPHDDKHDYDSLSNDLLEFTNDQKLASFFLAGHSMGGKTAVYFTVRYPERVSGLVVADISPFEDANKNPQAFEQHKNIIRTFSELKISDASSRKEIDERLSLMISSERIRNLIMKNLERETDTGFRWKLNIRTLQDNIGNMMEGLPLPADDYQEITGFPVLFLKGEFSDYLPDDDIPHILKIFPGAEFRIIKNSGHWIHSDNPEAVSEALLSLLDN
jgi:pimeloyl-ACP methyl ester carboxylesterase